MSACLQGGLKSPFKSLSPLSAAGGIYTSWPLSFSFCFSDLRFPFFNFRCNEDDEDDDDDMASSPPSALGEGRSGEEAGHCDEDIQVLYEGCQV